MATTLAGYWLGATATIRLTHLGFTLLGTALVAAGSLALNEYDERFLDARLKRTARRPIPSGKVDAAVALRLGTGLTVLGIEILVFACGIATAFLAAGAFAVYLFVYTPLKRVSPLSTLVGAVAGALPPMIGWTAAGGAPGGAWPLFLILFLWQIPHFLAIGWRWRADYTAAGVPIYCVLDPAGRATGLMMLIYSAALVAVSVLPFSEHIYLVGAIVLGTALVFASALFWIRPSDTAARRVFLVTVVYMPLLLGLMAAGR